MKQIKQMNTKVYLAGPISGANYGEATDWRNQAIYHLVNHGLDPYSPMRGKVYLLKEKEIADSYSDYPMSSITGINIRDYNDVRTSGAILVNLLDARKVSIGTVMEIAWARTHNVPVVLIMEETGNVHDHAMLTYNCIRVTTLNDGLNCIKQLLLPD
jgi:nucleoside 2-deoxyribosyltransferase